MYVPGDLGGHKRASHPPKLALQMVVIHNVGDEN